MGFWGAISKILGDSGFFLIWGFFEPKEPEYNIFGPIPEHPKIYILGIRDFLVMRIFFFVGRDIPTKSQL